MRIGDVIHIFPPTMAQRGKSCRLFVVVVLVVVGSTAPSVQEEVGWGGGVEGVLPITQGGNYPRIATIVSAPSDHGSASQTLLWLACVGQGLPNGGAALNVYSANTPITTAKGPTQAPVNWRLHGTVTVDADPSNDLAKCFLQPLDPVRHPGVVVAAFRHHAACSGAACQSYTLQTTISHDFGKTWEPTPAIITNSSTGVWEPFLFQPDAARNPGRLQCFYSKELQLPSVTPRAQDIVVQESHDSGRSWQPAVRTVVHRNNSRPGMPGVSLLPDNSTLLVFERTVAWTQFRVEYVRSFDGGRSWDESGLVYAPRGRDAGAPQVAYSSATSKVYVSFMTNDNHPAPVPPWVQGAAAKVSASLHPCTESECNIAFPTALPTYTITPASSFWPAVFQARGRGDNTSSVFAVTGFNDTAWITSHSLV